MEINILADKLKNDFSLYLKPTVFIDSNSPVIIEYSDNICKTIKSDIDKAIGLYYAVRDEITYNPYDIDFSENGMKASSTLEKKSGFCITKAILLSAAARAQKIPARLGFADVKNHMITKKLRDLMETDIFLYHGYAELFLDGKWIKATPAFNKSLCEKFNIQPLDFDGRNDSIFHAADNSGNKHMEYIKYHGHYHDLPMDEIYQAYCRYYPNMAKYTGQFSDSGKIKNKFEEESPEGKQK